MGPKGDPTYNAGRTYAVGDLHGKVTLFRHLLEALALTADDTLILLGDYVDRGEDSVATIELLTALVDHHSAQVVALLGNHDAAWLEVWTGDGFRERPNIPGAGAIWDASQGLPPLCIGQFLARIRHNVTYEDVFAYYSHAGAIGGKPFHEAGHEVWLWGEPDFLRDRTWHAAKPVVFGHYEVKEPLVTPTKICLDTAAYRTGVLTAMRMDDRTLIQVRRDGSVRWGTPSTSS